MANSKKITVKAVGAFFDKKENKRRNENDTFEVTEKRLEEIKTYQESNKLSLIEVVESEEPKDNDTPKKGKGKKQ